MLDVELPKLTLSSDERVDELIMDNTRANSHHQRPSKAQCLETIGSEGTEPKNKISIDERVEHRVEAIVSQLMSTCLEN